MIGRLNKWPVIISQRERFKFRRTRSIVLLAIPVAEGDSLRMQPKEVGNDEQKWYLVENKLVSLADTGQVVDIKKKDEDNGTKLCKYRYKGNDNQHWEFDYVD